MAKLFAKSDLMQNLKQELKEKNQKEFEERIKNAPPMTEMQKADQRYVDNIRRSYAEYYQHYGKREE